MRTGSARFENLSLRDLAQLMLCSAAGSEMPVMQVRPQATLLRLRLGVLAKLRRELCKL